MNVNVFVGTIERKDPKTKENQLVYVSVNADPRLLASWLYEALKDKLWCDILHKKMGKKKNQVRVVPSSCDRKKMNIKTKDGKTRSLEDPKAEAEVVAHIIENCQGFDHKTFETAKPFKKGGYTIRMWAR